MKQTLVLAAVITALGSLAQGREAVLRDITPSGYDFSKYENAAQFPVHNSPGKSYSPKSGLFNQTTYDTDKQFSVFYFCGEVESENEEAAIQKANEGITVRDFGGNLGKCLVINEKWSPLASASDYTSQHPDVKGSTINGGSNTSLGIAFYLSHNDIPHCGKDNAIRVRIVLDILHRGCHDVNGHRGLIESFAMCDKQADGTAWYRPESEYPWSEGKNIVSKTVPAYGYEFAKWENEGTTVAQIPAEPAILKPTEKASDPLDNTSHSCAGVPNYYMQLDRFMVYEWDTYTNTDQEDLLAAIHFDVANMSIVIKEVKFFAIENAAEIADTPASLLNKRAKSWRYYTKDACTINRDKNLTVYLDPSTTWTSRHLVSAQGLDVELKDGYNTVAVSDEDVKSLSFRGCNTVNDGKRYMYANHEAIYNGTSGADAVQALRAIDPTTQVLHIYGAHTDTHEITYDIASYINAEIKHDTAFNVEEPGTHNLLNGSVIHIKQVADPFEMRPMATEPLPTFQVKLIPQDGSRHQVLTPDADGVFTVTADKAMRIEVKDPNTGIDNVDANDTAAPRRVYNLQGVLLHEDADEATLNGLPRGLYIIGGKKQLLK